ncbi:MAG: beta,4-mannosyltransferase [Gaiellaceae bacterium]|nr:beta,4-mannosyltransferase [Gaiellaceae bacterium]
MRGGAPGTGPIVRPASPAAGESVRVLAWPAHANRGQNPYTSSLYRELERLGATIADFTPRRALTGKYDVLHVHWVDTVLAARPAVLARAKAHVFLGLVRLMQRRGTTVVWTIHNLASHDQAVSDRFARAWWRRFVESVDVHISLSQVGRAQAEEAFARLRDVPGFVVPHAHYRDEYANIVGGDAARSELGVADDARVLLFFGMIRPYKNAVALVRTFRAVDDDLGVLLVAGQPFPPTLARELAAAAGGDERVRLDLESIAAERVQLYFNAADLVVLPYTRVLNSGAALLALSFDRPLLLPDTPVFRELQASVGESWVRTYDGDLTSADLVAALAWAREVPRRERAPLDAYEPRLLAEATFAAYRAGPPSPAAG